MSASSPFEGATERRLSAAYASWRGQPNWLHRVVACALFLILLGIAAFLLLWGLIVAAVIIAVSAVIFGVRAAYRSFTGENAMRRNVRVLRRP